MDKMKINITWLDIYGIICHVKVLYLFFSSILLGPSIKNLKRDDMKYWISVLYN